MCTDSDERDDGGEDPNHDVCTQCGEIYETTLGEGTCPACRDGAE